MADRRMKPLFEPLTAEVEEMDRYRRRLARQLGRPSHRHSAGIATLAAAALAAWLGGRFFLQSPGAELTAALRVADLETIETLATSLSPAQLRDVRELARQGSSPERWNAIMLLALVEPGESGIRHATEGLAEDPRAAFRYAYLEQLLDRGDEYRYRAEAVEELMDRETDLEVWQLFRELYRIAS